MPTAKQSAASRANARKSTGPRTEFGKAASRFNALKHGIDAKQQIMFTESAEDLAELTAEYHEAHSPSTADERLLVDTLVNNEWRIRRMRCVEAGLWASNLFPDKAASSDAFKTAGPTFERLQRVVNSCERNYHRASKELRTVVAAREAQLSAAAEVVPAPQPEESKITSESSASFRTNSKTAATAAPKAAPKPARSFVDERVRLSSHFPGNHRAPALTCNVHSLETRSASR